MSLIFGGLQRLHFDLNDKAWSEISFKNSTLCKEEVNVQSYPDKQERGDEKKYVTEICTKLEGFLLSTYNVLDVSFFIPRIFFTFCSTNGKIQKYDIITNDLKTKKFVLPNDQPCSNKTIYDRGKPMNNANTNALFNRTRPKTLRIGLHHCVTFCRALIQESCAGKRMFYKKKLSRMTFCAMHYFSK